MTPTTQRDTEEVRSIPWGIVRRIILAQIVPLTLGLLWLATFLPAAAAEPPPLLDDLLKDYQSLGLEYQAILHAATYH